MTLRNGVTVAVRLVNEEQTFTLIDGKEVKSSALYGALVTDRRRREFGYDARPERALWKALDAREDSDRQEAFEVTGVNAA